MPIAYEIDEGLQVFVARASSHVTSEDVGDLFASISTDVRFRAGLSHLYDLRSVKRMEIAAESVQGRVLACTGGLTKVALVYRSPLVGRWLERFERLANGGGFSVRSFARIDAARIWLVGGEAVV